MLTQPCFEIRECRDLSDRKIDSRKKLVVAFGVWDNFGERAEFEPLMCN